MLTCIQRWPVGTTQLAMSPNWRYVTRLVLTTPLTRARLELTMILDTVNRVIYFCLVLDPAKSEPPKPN